MAPTASVTMNSNECNDDQVSELRERYGEYMTLAQVADALYLSVNTVQKKIGAEVHQHLPWVTAVRSARVWTRSNKLFYTHLIASVTEAM